jgi:hypothetical protein
MPTNEQKTSEPMTNEPINIVTFAAKAIEENG